MEKSLILRPKKGEETFKRLLEMDEGAPYLGEVILVPHSSPISQSSILFYNTLFDENASCHITLGAANLTNMKGGANMNQKQLKESGLNTSILHVDFMICSSEMNIDGVLEDGSREAEFRYGECA